MLCIMITIIAKVNHIMLNSFKILVLNIIIFNSVIVIIAYLDYISHKTYQYMYTFTVTLTKHIPNINIAI